MLLKFVPVAFVAAAVFASSADAQNRRPAEMPPAGYAGQQYIDSRGCMFIRAGYGGQTSWVARIDRARKPICGMTPSVNTMAQARRTLQAPEQPQAAPVAAAPRTAPVVRQPQYTAPPPVLAAPAAPMRTYQGGPGANPVLGASRTAGCPANAPYGRMYERAGAPGGILVCGTQPPNFTGTGGIGQDRQGALMPGFTGVQVAQATYSADTPINYAPQFADQAIQTRPPKGYKAAWDDGRLNPNRARGTVGGHQQMQRVWTTDEVPQRGVNEPRKRQWYEGVIYPVQKQRVVTVTTKSAPQVRSGARRVQVGSFGVAANAERAARRLQALGLPVQVSRANLGGKAVQVVSAGPFASPAQAQSALRAAQNAGFGDAILRR